MTDTEELIELKEFLDEEVPCEGYVSEHHPADIYVQFHCPGCDKKTIGANCHQCWGMFVKFATEAHTMPPSPCCHNHHWGIEDLSVLGPVR